MEIYIELKNKKYIVYLALLGDPMLPIGIPGTGGFNKTVRELIDNFRETETNIVLITNQTIYNSDYHISISSNIDIYRINFDSKWENNQDLIVENINTIFERICSILEMIGISSVKLLHSFYWLSGFIAKKLKQKYNLPFIHTVISLSQDKISTNIKPHTRYQKDIEESFLKEAEFIFAITEQEKTTLIEKYFIDESRIKVVGRSINDRYLHSEKETRRLISLTDAKSEFDITDDAWCVKGAFIYVGRIVAIKGVTQIITAWINASKQNNISNPLWIVGGTPSQIIEIRNTLKQSGISISEYEKSNKIIWWGNLDSEGISTLLLKSAALIMHSRFEAGGRVIIEALSFGVPVIATPYGFAKDYIFDGYNGYLTEFDDIDMLTEKLLLFSEQPYLSSVLGNAARKYMNNVYSNWDYFNNHLNAYNSYIYENVKFNCESTKVIPKDLSSFKATHYVNAFPYYDTDLTNQELVDMLFEKYDKVKVHLIENNKFHSNIYYFTYNDELYYIKGFYHILADSFTKILYKNINVISAEIMMKKSIISLKYSAVAPADYYSCRHLFYCVKKFRIINSTESIDILKDFWKQDKPDKEYMELYTAKSFDLLKKQIQNDTNEMINNLFCLEIAYSALENKINKYKSILEAVKKLANSTAAVFGLNYGKSVLNHIAETDNGLKLLPCHSCYLGELGIDLAIYFMDLQSTDIKLWNQLKAEQNVINTQRLDISLKLPREKLRV